MLKPTLLRKALTDAVPYLKQNPDSLIFLLIGALLSPHWRRPCPLNTNTPSI